MGETRRAGVAINEVACRMAPSSVGASVFPGSASCSGRAGSGGAAIGGIVRALFGAQVWLQHMLVADAFGVARGRGLDVDAVQHLVEQHAVDAAPYAAQLERRCLPQLRDIDDAGTVQPLLHARDMRLDPPQRAGSALRSKPRPDRPGSTG